MSSLFPRPTLPELDARIARTLADLGRANGEAYTDLLGTLAGLRGLRAQVERDERWPRGLIERQDRSADHG